MSALLDKAQHIPYRSSKLTRLLSDSLCGTAKTCLIATVDGSKENASECLSTLEYATRAGRITNRPTRNVGVEASVLVSMYLEEIRGLNERLRQSWKDGGVRVEVGEYEALTERVKVLEKEKSEREKVEIVNKEAFEDLKGTLEETKIVLESMRGIPTVFESNEGMFGSLKESCRTILKTFDQSVTESKELDGKLLKSVMSILDSLDQDFVFSFL